MCRSKDTKQQLAEVCLHEQGLEALKEYDYVAIFDADFKPDTDFLVSLRLQLRVLVDSGVGLWQVCILNNTADMLSIYRWRLSPTS